MPIITAAEMLVERHSTAAAVLALAQARGVRVVRRGAAWHFIGPMIDVVVTDPSVLRPSDFASGTDRESTRYPGV